MTRDEIQRLMGGYATGSLTDSERKLLFEAALDDQDLFDQLAHEQALKELIDEPGARGRLIAALAPAETSRGGWKKPLAWGLAVMFVVSMSVAALMLVRSGDRAQIAQNQAPQPQIAPSAPPAASSTPAAPGAIAPQPAPASSSSPVIAPPSTPPISTPESTDRRSAKNHEARAKKSVDAIGTTVGGLQPPQLAQDDLRRKEEQRTEEQRKDEAKRDNQAPPANAPAAAAPPPPPRTAQVTEQSSALPIPAAQGLPLPSPVPSQGFRDSQSQPGQVQVGTGSLPAGQAQAQTGQNQKSGGGGGGGGARGGAGTGGARAAAPAPMVSRAASSMKTAPARFAFDYAIVGDDLVFKFFADGYFSLHIAPGGLTIVDSRVTAGSTRREHITANGTEATIVFSASPQSNAQGVSIDTRAASGTAEDPSRARIDLLMRFF